MQKGSSFTSLLMNINFFFLIIFSLDAVSDQVKCLLDKDVTEMEGNYFPSILLWKDPVYPVAANKKFKYFLITILNSMWSKLLRTR